MNKDFFHKTSCRVCGGLNFVKILDLGNMPLSNAFLKKQELDKEEKKFPLVVYFCRDCSLLQVLDIVSPKLLFGQYYYQTSTSLPLVNHFIGLGKKLLDRFIESKNNLIIDIGGNDAVLLNSIKSKCRVLNIEPAKNIAKISKEKEVDTINDFFSKELAKEIFQKYGSAKVVIASNVFAHIDDLEEVLQGVKILIGEKGVFVIEVHWVANLLGLAGVGGFDQIYHEHLSYFSLLTLQKLFDKFNLKIFDVKLIPIHGQSLQVYIKKNSKDSVSVNEFFKKEKELGLDKVQTYSSFAKKVEKNKKELISLLRKLKKENKKIIGYGAPAKGNILLNYCGIDNNILEFIVDDSSLKQGLYAPGVHVPVLSTQKIKETVFDYALLLAWNYKDSILEKEKDLREQGLKFIIPVPEVKIL
ncbi:MAG: class I SAM-dependent methyltransferase [Patescibacteria group bacterium]|nr:class I SAM-dependent methyltransferase [Patescibacteria group bacterium]